MVIKTPRSVTKFCDLFQKQLTAWQRKVIPRMIVSILMSSGNPNYAVMAGKVLSAARNRSSVSRFYKTIRFNPDQIMLAALEKFLAERSDQRNGTWFLIIDGTSTKRGGFTKIGNAIKYRKKQRRKKGGYPSAKAHMFLMGILLAPDGTRFPLPAMPYYTKEYCRQNRIEFKTQVTLAVQMIMAAPIPLDVEKVVVLADEYYEGEAVHRACVTKGYSYIMPTDSRRCCADEQGNRTAITLHERGRQLTPGLFHKIVLVEGQEQTTPYRRLSDPGRKTKRVYRAHTENGMVAGLGLVRITYSWKKKRRKDKRSSGDTYKVLISNDMTLSVDQVVEYYELRWQIELFFRELKSIIGLHKFRGDSFTAFARFVSMVLLAFMFLEWNRIAALKMTRPRSRKETANLSKARTHSLVHRLTNEIDTENVEYILECFDQKKTQAECTAVFRRLLRAA